MCVMFYGGINMSFSFDFEKYKKHNSMNYTDLFDDEYDYEYAEEYAFEDGFGDEFGDDERY